MLVDTLIPRLKALFSLSFAEVMLTQFSFFIAYMLVSIPAGQLIGRIGYMHGIVVGQVVMAAGGLLFALAAAFRPERAQLVASVPEFRRVACPPGYARHRPETTLLDALVERHYLAFRELRAMAGRPVPDYVEAEFDAYLKCGRLEEGFMRHIPVPHPCGAPFGRANRLSCRFVLRLRCAQCHAEKLVAFSCKKRGFCPSCGARRMAETASGQVRYALKTPYRDGTTHIVLEPLDFMARLAALVPPPRRHLTRCHGVFAPHSGQQQWVFGIEIESCARCGGRLRVIASIEDSAVIARILAHLDRTVGIPPELAPLAGVTSRWMARMRMSRTGWNVPSPPARARLRGACEFRQTTNSLLTGVMLDVTTTTEYTSLRNDPQLPRQAHS